MSIFRYHSWWIYILLFFVAQVSSLLVAFFYARVSEEQLMGTTVVISLFTANLLAIFLYAFFRPSSVTWSSILDGFRGRNGRRTLLVCLLALPLTVLINLAQEVFFPNIPNLVGNEMMLKIMGHPLGLLTVAFLGPLSEELLFRGGVQVDLQKRYSDQAWWVIVGLTAALFSMVHMNPAQMPIAFILGLLLGFAFWWTGSLSASICIHVFNNSFACVLGLLSPNDDSLVHLLGGNTAAGLMALVCVFFLVLLFRAIQKEGLKAA